MPDVDQPDPLELALPELDQIRVARAPEFVALVAEVLETEAGLRLVREHHGAPVLEVLDPADLDLGLVDVDPVVGEQLGSIDDQADGEEVAILELSGGPHGLRPGRGDRAS